MNHGEGNTMTVRCVLRDQTGEQINAGERPLTFTFGRGEVIAGLEALLRNRPVGYRGCHHIAAEHAYGAHRPELVFEAVRDNLPAGIKLAPGVVLEPGGAAGRFQLRVVSMTERGALLDGNHPLAGKDLDVEVEVLQVGSPTPPRTHGLDRPEP